MKHLFSLLLLLPLATSAQKITGTYAIKNVQTGIYLRIKDANTKNGTPIVAYTPVNWKCVTWDFQQVNGQTYQLKNLFSGKSLQPVQPAAGTTLEEQPLNPGLSVQQFEFIPVEKDVYRIKLKNTELYLTPADDQGTTNAPVKLDKKSDGKLQYWSLHQQSPTM